MAEAKAPKKSSGRAEEDTAKAARPKRREQGVAATRKTPTKSASKQTPKDWEHVT
jgi:hypothetical protein